MQRDWADSAGKRRYTQKDLGYLVTTHLQWSAQPLQRLQTLAQDTLPELLETENGVGPVESYRTLTAASFVCYYIPLFEVRRRYDHDAMPGTGQPSRVF